MGSFLGLVKNASPKLVNASKSLAFSGDGATSEGDFHEALNVAAVWGLPVIFLIENNGYGLSTPSSEQFICKQLADKGIGYGMKAITIDGNNVLEVYNTIRQVRQECIQEQKPVMVECMTFRMRGHEEASGVKYVPPELFEIWAKKDPVKRYESFLLEEGVLTAAQIDDIQETFRRQIEQHLERGMAVPPVQPDTAEELQDVYAPVSGQARLSPASSVTRELRFVQAISEGLDECMKAFDNLILMGQDIAEYGGAFKITEGFLNRYGKERVRNTPLCESAIVGTALGLSIKGFKSMMEMQFADFVTVGFNQIINNLAKIHYRWGQQADVVIRMPTGGGVGAGPFHSQSNEAWFTHTPGLKVVYPSNPADAKGLLIAAILDPNPVMYFEHKALYRSVSGPVPEGFYTVEIGKANVVQEGSLLSVITYGSGVHWALEWQAQHPEHAIEILDLRTLLPLDYDAIRKTVYKTGKVLVLHEDTLSGGWGAELAAWIGEHCFESLDAPVMRCGSLDTPVPFASELEQNFMAKNRLPACLQQLIGY